MKQQVFVKAGAIQKSKAMGLLYGLVFSLSAFSQTDTTQPKAFIFSKYQLPVQSDGASISFFNAPLKLSPYKIHYKIKTLMFPADPQPERPSLIGALINSYIESNMKDQKEDDFIVPVKKY